MIIRHLGIQDYETIWRQMKDFTTLRDSNTPDEFWLLEHNPVYTQGQAGKAEHILNPQNIPIIQSDRGGQVTYHGPGQLVLYVLMDIKRRNLGVRTLVCQLEQAFIALLKQFTIIANIKQGAPGVYVGEKKIASIGLRVKNGCTYHGVALNVAMDLSPFLGINPCGYNTLQMTQMKDYCPEICIEDVSTACVANFLTPFGC
jgi:lipoyl(octanoyl) transferase